MFFAKLRFHISADFAEQVRKGKNVVYVLPDCIQPLMFDLVLSAFVVVVVLKQKANGSASVGRHIVSELAYQ